MPDAVYKTMQGKYRAVCRQVEECHKNGQPVLVGTVSIEKSELISAMLKRMGVPHNVLNAKQHEKEAEIVAQAGKLGAVTIATNMAGRGTDIVLGGNAEYMAKAQLRKELIAQFAENESAQGEAPAQDTQSRIEQLIVESDGHADTTDEGILAARKRFEELLAQYKPGVVFRRVLQQKNHWRCTPPGGAPGYCPHQSGNAGGQRAGGGAGLFGPHRVGVLKTCCETGKLMLKTCKNRQFSACFTHCKMP